MLEVSSAELTAWIGAYLWPFFRIGATLMAMPVIGTRNVSVRFRVLLAILITVIVAPLLPAMPAVDPLSGEGILITFHQILIGVAIGFVFQLVFQVFILAGQIIAMQAGLGFASMMDPQSGASVPVVSQFYSVLVTLVFLALNGHHAIIEAAVRSFELMPVAAQGLHRDAMWQLVLWGSDMFAGAVSISLPAVAALLLVNIGFGVMTRVTPQLNIFAVGFPITLIVGFIVMYFTLASVLGQFEFYFVNGLTLVSQMLTPGR